MKHKVLFISGCTIIAFAVLCILSKTNTAKCVGAFLFGVIFLLSRTKIGAKYATSCDEAIDAMERFLQRL